MTFVTYHKTFRPYSLTFFNHNNHASLVFKLFRLSGFGFHFLPNNIDLKSAFDLGAPSDFWVAPFEPLDVEDDDDDATALGTNDNWLLPFPLEPSDSPEPSEGPDWGVGPPGFLGGGRLISTESCLPLKSDPSVAMSAWKIWQSLRFVITVKTFCRELAPSGVRNLPIGLKNKC